MTHFCPGCWRAVDAGATSCAHCHGNLALLDRRSFEDKLIAALRHPEPLTRQRAAFILGELHAAAAVGVFAELLRATTEPFFACEMILALGKIGGPGDEPLLMEALDHESFLVRQAAVQALVRRSGPSAAAALKRAACDRSPSVRRLAHEIESNRRPC